GNFLSEINIDLNDELISNGTVGKSIKSSQYAISNDIENDADMFPWRADALRLGYKSVASFPLNVLGKVIGTINLYSSEVAFFSDQEIQLLNEMAMDVSFALEAIDHQVERNRAEEKLIESEERYRRITEGLTDYLYTVKVKDGKAIETIHNEACFFITGYTSGEFEADSYLWFNMIMPEDREMVTQKFAKILEGKDLPPIEHRIICKDGTVRWISDTPIPKYNSDGKLISYEGVIKDITVHKQNEEALLKLKKAVDSSGEVIFLTDNEGTFTYTNPAFTTLYGFSADDVIGKASPRILKSGLYETSYYDKFWKILSDGGEAKGEIINKRKDGKLLTVEHSANQIIDENNNIIGFLGVQRDISERKKAEALLLSRTLLLETQLETSIDGIVVVDNNGHTIILNKRFCKLWGIPKEVINSKEKVKMLEYIAPKLKRPAEFLINVEYLTHNPDEKNREEIQLIDGRFFDRYTASMLDDTGKNYGRIWFFRDITKRKMTELALIESEEKFRKLAETANDSILIIDSQGTIISWNKAAELTFGYSFSEVSGKKIAIILEKKYKSLQPGAFIEMTTEGDSLLPSKTIKLEALKKDKKAFPIELSLSLWEANNTTYFTAIIRDISARVKIEQELATYRNHLEELVKARTKELNRANELLKQKIAKDEEYEMMLQQSLEKEKELSEMKSRFISTTSHEFRTP
ncbi:MAG: PAS domain S-box protein, partial [Ignavibacteria bacterium]|nr:PAS domain S-box protein [Ignavibacteria bacterium]